MHLRPPLRRVFRRKSIKSSELKKTRQTTERVQGKKERRGARERILSPEERTTGKKKKKNKKARPAIGSALISLNRLNPKTVESSPYRVARTRLTELNRTSASRFTQRNLEEKLERESARV